MNVRKSFLLKENIDSVYLGGGTPSILDEATLAKIFTALHNTFDIPDKIEITLECNPEDVTEDMIKAWCQLGINRLSIGIQSFDDEELKYMNRVHDSAQSIEALELIANSNFENYTADLMFGLVDSTIESWKTNLETMSTYNPPHLSIYNLTIEEQTVFANWKHAQKLEELSDDIQQEQFLLADEFLTQLGYEHYEVSNYAKPGFKALHNSNYWNRQPYLGLGPSAHSFRDHIRSWNVANNASYLKMCEGKEHFSSKEHLDYFDRYNEVVMLGLRRSAGIDPTSLIGLPSEIMDHFLEVTERWIKDGFLFKKNDRIKLKKEHWYICDKVSAELFISKG